MSAARLQALQYITAVLLVLLVSWHLAMRIPEFRGLESFVDTIKPNIVYYEFTTYGVVLFLFAVVALFHGINGLRIILLEIHHGSLWDKLVNAAAVIVFIVMAGAAAHSILYVPPPA